MKRLFALIAVAIALVVMPGCAKQWTEADRAKQKARAQANMESSKAAGERMGKSGPAGSESAKKAAEPADEGE